MNNLYFASNLNQINLDITKVKAKKAKKAKTEAGADEGGATNA